MAGIPTAQLDVIYHQAPQGKDNYMDILTNAGMGFLGRADASDGLLHQVGLRTFQPCVPNSARFPSLSQGLDTSKVRDVCS